MQSEHLDYYPNPEKYDGISRGCPIVTYEVMTRTRSDGLVKLYSTKFADCGDYFELTARGPLKQEVYDGPDIAHQCQLT